MTAGRKTTAPQAKVDDSNPVIAGKGFGRALKLLRSTEEIKAFFKDLYEALVAIPPAEPDNRLYDARMRTAEKRYQRIVDSADPPPRDIEDALEMILAAALATQSAEDDNPSASSVAFKPQALAGAIWAKRRGSGK